MNQKSFFQELRDRHVFKEIKAYLFGGATMIPLVYLLQLLTGLSDNVTIICFIIFVSLFPSVFLFSYYHGESKSTPWSKAEKIGIPVNIVITFLIIFFFFFDQNLYANQKESTVKNIEIIDEFGNLSNVDIVKKEHQKKILICLFENNSNNSDLNWLQYGFPEALMTDLSQDSYISARNIGDIYSLAEKGYDLSDSKATEDINDIKVPLSVSRQIANENSFKHMLTGSINKIGDNFQITTQLFEVNNSKLIATNEFEGNDIFLLTDEIAIQTKKDLKLPTKHIEQFIDLPTSSLLTNSYLAFKHYNIWNIKGYSSGMGGADFKILQNQLTKAIKLDPSFIEPYDSHLLWFEIENKPDSVAWCWNNIMKNISRLPNREQYKHKYYYFKFKNKLEEASNCLDTWSKLATDDTTPLYIVAGSYTDRDMYQEALNQYNLILEIDQESAQLLSTISRVYQDLKNYKKAIEYNKRAIVLEPLNNTRYSSLSNLYYALGELDSAIVYKNKELMLNPIDVFTNIELLRLNTVITGNSSGADKELNDLYQYCNNKNDSMDVYDERQLYLKKQGRLNEALEVADSMDAFQQESLEGVFPQEIVQMIKVSSQLPLLLDLGKQDDVHMIIDLIYTMKNNSNNSNQTRLIKSIKNMFQHSLPDFFLHLSTTQEYKDEMLSYLAEEKEKKEQRKKQGSAYFHFKSNSGTIALIEAKIATFDDDYEKAVKLLESEKTETRNSRYFYDLGRYYQKLKKYDKAEENFLIALKKSPFFGKTNYYTALFYHEIGQHKEAQEYLNTALTQWENADPAFIFYHMAKQTAKEWDIKI